MAWQELLQRLRPCCNNTIGNPDPGWPPSCDALISAEFTFKGQSAHSASAPWQGRDALDAVELMSMGFDKLREHLEPTHRSHRVINYGGDQPNVIPGLAKDPGWFFRESSIDKAQINFEKAKKVAQGAATMTDTEYTVQVFSAIWPTRGNRTMAEVTQKNVELVGMPKWTEEEHNLAKALQRNLKSKEEGLHKDISPLRESRQGVSSNDAGEVTWIVPTGRVTFPEQHPEHSEPPLGRRSSARHFDRAQGSRGRRQGPRGLRCRFPNRSEAGRRSKDYVQEGDGWISVQVVSPAGPKAADISQQGTDGALSTTAVEVLSKRETEV